MASIPEQSVPRRSGVSSVGMCRFACALRARLGMGPSGSASHVRRLVVPAVSGRAGLTGPGCVAVRRGAGCGGAGMVGGGAVSGGSVVVPRNAARMLGCLRHERTPVTG